MTKDDKALDRLIETAQGLKAAVAKAKAEAPKAPKATKATKSDAMMPGSPEFNAIVAGLVAEALAKVG